MVLLNIYDEHYIKVHLAEKTCFSVFTKIPKLIQHMLVVISSQSDW